MRAGLVGNNVTRRLFFWEKSSVFRAVISHSVWLRCLSFFFFLLCVAYSRGLFTGDEHCLHKGCTAFRPAGREIVRDSYLEAAFSSSSGSRGYSELISQRQALQSATSRHVTSSHPATLFFSLLRAREGTLKCEMRFLCPQDTSIIDDSRVWSSRGIMLFIPVTFQLALCLTVDPGIVIVLLCRVLMGFYSRNITFSWIWSLALI